MYRYTFIFGTTFPPRGLLKVPGKIIQMFAAINTYDAAALVEIHEAGEPGPPLSPPSLSQFKLSLKLYRN